RGPRLERRGLFSGVDRPSGQWPSLPAFRVFPCRRSGWAGSGTGPNGGSNAQTRCRGRGKHHARRPGGSVIGIFGSRANRVARWLWIGESVLVVLAVVAAIWLRFPDDPAGRDLLFQRGPVPALLVAAFVTLSMAAFGLYQSHIRLNRSELLLRLLLAF